LKIRGWKYFNKDVLYMRKKHDCPKCKTQLEAVKVSRVVHSESPEAQEFDFSLGDDQLVGNVKFTWKEFECPECGLHLTVEEMKRAEGISPVDKERSKRMGKILFAISVIVFFAFFGIKYYLS
jgi:transcription initiation factor IIE alpha subunit